MTRLYGYLLIGALLIYSACSLFVAKRDFIKFSHKLHKEHAEECSECHTDLDGKEKGCAGQKTLGEF